MFSLLYYQRLARDGSLTDLGLSKKYNSINLLEKINWLDVILIKLEEEKNTNNKSNEMEESIKFYFKVSKQ